MAYLTSSIACTAWLHSLHSTTTTNPSSFFTCTNSQFIAEVTQHQCVIYTIFFMTSLSWFLYHSKQFAWHLHYESLKKTQENLFDRFKNSPESISIVIIVFAGFLVFGGLLLFIGIKPFGFKLQLTPSFAAQTLSWQSLRLLLPMLFNPWIVVANFVGALAIWAWIGCCRYWLLGLSEQDTFVFFKQYQQKYPTKPSSAATTSKPKRF